MKILRPILTMLLLVPQSVLAIGLDCRPQMYCSDTSCAATDPDDTDGGTYVRDAMGAAPEVYTGEGQWAAAERVAKNGTWTYTGTNTQNAAVMVSVRRQGGVFIYTLLDGDMGKRTWVMTGICGNVDE
jgi:hypothetical protein